MVNIGNPTAYAQIGQQSGNSLLDIAKLYLLREQGEREQQRAEREKSLYELELEKERLAEEQRKRVSTLSDSAASAWMNDDKMGLRENLTKLSSINPERAKQVYDFFGTLDRGNAVEATLKVFAAASMPDSEINLQNQTLDDAIETIGVPNHYLTRMIQTIRDMPGGDDRNMAEIAFLKNASEKLNLLPGSGTQDNRYQFGSSYLGKVGEDMYSFTERRSPGLGGVEMVQTPFPKGAKIATKTTGETPKELKQRGVETKRLKSEASAAVELVKKSYEDRQAINAIDRIYEETSRLISNPKTFRDGLGFFERKLDKFTEFHALVDNLQDRLALKAAITAKLTPMSDTDIELLKSASLPTNISAEELRKWIKRRQKAIGKLRDYYEEFIHYMSAQNEEGYYPNLSDWLDHLNRTGREKTKGRIKSEDDILMETILEGE